jgi:hypothetical protein
MDLRHRVRQSLFRVRQFDLFIFKKHQVVQLLVTQQHKWATDTSASKSSIRIYSTHIRNTQGRDPDRSIWTIWVTSAVLLASVSD